MNAQIVMVVDGDEYVYGTYPFNTLCERNRVNDLALKVKDERSVDVYVKEVD